MLLPVLFFFDTFYCLHVLLHVLHQQRLLYLFTFFIRILSHHKYRHLALLILILYQKELKSLVNTDFFTSFYKTKSKVLALDFVYSLKGLAKRHTLSTNPHKDWQTLKNFDYPAFIATYLITLPFFTVYNFPFTFTLPENVK